MTDNDIYLSATQAGVILGTCGERVRQLFAAGELQRHPPTEERRFFSYRRSDVLALHERREAARMAIKTSAVIK